jgi:hypothetical protein
MSLKSKWLATRPSAEAGTNNTNATHGVVDNKTREDRQIHRTANSLSLVLILVDIITIQIRHFLMAGKQTEKQYGKPGSRLASCLRVLSWIEIFSNGPRLPCTRAGPAGAELTPDKTLGQ